MSTWTLERYTALLKRAGIDPDGYGNRIGESLEEFTARLAARHEYRCPKTLDGMEHYRCTCGADLDFDPLDYIPVQDGVRESI